MTEKEIKDYICSLDEVWVDKSINKNLSIYKTGRKNDDISKIFAIVYDNTKPLKISLKCDELLAKKLREDYETVLPGENLNKKYWNTIICSGQLDIEYIKSLIILSYNLASAE